ncbi:aminotransferase class V-fold PLP-dependent enzyme [Parachitinimonas caeni]|uniref:Aminotransferase class V-fold PLP-dependent enzyme n=1 Tax=Parachitinimonas caeni TaxID=3031301 RepID=A0ABT7E4Q9_9NEIS|nr:aminotransferase class V-fold PLP-dependent enzyme [Parachitinimonas caeni]MDK2125907.1 aminotransferase class V-fold PLP-dependent enzyme [Parachitinimonas caeni]
MTDIANAIAALGDGPLCEESLRRHVFPLFSRVLARHEIYLANHSLGRPLDQTAADVASGLDAWYGRMDDAWEDWMEAFELFRRMTARLVGARPDCIVPKASAGQGLRTVLNSFHYPPRVVTTRAEFDSLDVILKQYQVKRRAEVVWVDTDDEGLIDPHKLVEALELGVDLLVVSQAFFSTGQLLPRLADVIAAAHHYGAFVFLDCYHSYGVVPLDVMELGVDFAVAGSYKYLRGGPGACWLYLAPWVIDSGFTTLDTGWFAKKSPFSYQRPDPPVFAEGGDAFLESTFAVLPWLQARAGLELTTEIGVGRLREYSLQQKRMMAKYLADHALHCVGMGEEFGAFLRLPHPEAVAMAARLKAHGVNVDARSNGVRICPDLLNTEAEMAQAASQIAELWHAR